MAKRGWTIAAVLVVCLASPAFAQNEKATPKQGTKMPSKPKAVVSPTAALLKGATKYEGVITVYKKGQSLYAELSGSNYSSEYIVVMAIARGIGQTPVLGGFTWQTGDDWVWRFRKIGKRVHVIRRNVRFKATPGYPEYTAVRNAYTDSVLFALRVIGKGPSGGDLVDLSQIFMSDLPQISRYLPGFSFSASKSTWGSIKGFRDNLQLQVAATYASFPGRNIDTVADSRGATINIHYSVSQVPSSSYVPRLADDRVGYFLTVVKDFSRRTNKDRFVRYINRWHLQKPRRAGSGPTVPKEPIIFWIEKTVPFKYRKPISDGVREWNKAFLKAGWIDAIEVRQQPDDATWDPEDINFNTFRWITSEAGFAMGPSRVNPYTGQILDADIIFDADFLQFWKREFESLSPKAIASMTGGVIDRPLKDKHGKPIITIKPVLTPLLPRQQCMLSKGMSRQLAFGASVIMSRFAPSKVRAVEQEKLIMQALKEVTMHEVGHTLGLRHNFKASRMLNLKELNDPAKAKDGTVASVMDYAPTNIMPKKMKQGSYYTNTIGPYDYWAIEYGYKYLAGSTYGDRAGLQKIAARSGEPSLAYATDEDTGGFEPDPDANRFDLGKDGIEYAKVQAQLVKEMVPGLIDRMTEKGDDYTKARRAFNVLMSQHGQAMFFAARYVGGLHVTRSHKGDKNAKAPITPVDVKKQREALGLLEQQMFSDKPFQFPPKILNYLAASNWQHWGSGSVLQKDFPIHSYIAMWQSRVLSQVMSSITLERLHDTELKIEANKDALTSAELIERMTKAVFAEVTTVKKGKFTNRKPAISSLRRNLQRIFFRRMADIAMGHTFAPDDCQTVAFAELASLKDRIDALLKTHGKDVTLDSYSRAHLFETKSRIQKVIDARLTLFAP